jgi:hypothetical protein
MNLRDRMLPLQNGLARLQELKEAQSIEQNRSQGSANLGKQHRQGDLSSVQQRYARGSQRLHVLRASCPGHRFSEPRPGNTT